jgi:segregation and condensation protein B
LSDQLEPTDISPQAPEVGSDYSTGAGGPSSSDPGPIGQRIEALLYIAGAPVSIAQLSEALQADVRAIEHALEQLSGAWAERGVRLQRQGKSYQITTAPELAADVERFLDVESTTRLSRPALEVLAIVAYQQPITRPFIDSIRGVNSDSVIRTLLRYGLIEEVGRSEAPGRPILYATTVEFLHQFGLDSLDTLPPLAEEDLPEPADILEIFGSEASDEAKP